MPIDSQVERRIPDVNSRLNFGRSYDTRTIFYDIFVDRNSNRLVGMGPQLLNLKDEIFPFSIYFEGRKLSYRFEEVGAISYVISELLPDSLPPTIQIELRFMSFKYTVTINWQHDEQSIRKFDGMAITLSTLQKNNQIQWVVDWIKWHMRLHGANRIVLYDNRSANQDELVAALHCLEPEAQIIFVNWPFEYGAYPYNFCQNGSLNHCRLRFPVTNGYCINLDVDEYLAKTGKERLVDYLDRKLQFPVGAIMIQQFAVPNVSTYEYAKKIPRIINYYYRYRNPGFKNLDGNWQQDFKLKYIYRFDRIYSNSIHRPISPKGSIYRNRYPLRIRITHRLKLELWRLRKKLKFRVHLWSPRPNIDRAFVPVSELFFFQFFGINTRWNIQKRWVPVQINETEHVYEPRIADLALKAGIEDEIRFRCPKN